jgi:hypothetical protein
MWVYTYTPTWELIGTNIPTWERIGTVTWAYTKIHLHGNSIGTDRTRPDRTRQTHFKSFQNIQADRGFATSRLCTDEDGTTISRGIRDT